MFGLHDHKQQDTLDPLELRQWVFYLVLTSNLNKEFCRKKDISLKQLEEMKAKPRICRYSTLKPCFDEVTQPMRAQTGYAVVADTNTSPVSVDRNQVHSGIHRQSTDV